MPPVSLYDLEHWHDAQVSGKTTTYNREAGLDKYSQTPYPQC